MLTFSRFSLNDVEVITATIDLEEVRSYREQKSRAMQARDQPKYDRIEVESKCALEVGEGKQLTQTPVSLSAEGDAIDLRLHPTTEKDVVYNVPEKEIAYGPACYLVCVHHSPIQDLN